MPASGLAWTPCFLTSREGINNSLSFSSSFAQEEKCSPRGQGSDIRSRGSSPPPQKRRQMALRSPRAIIRAITNRSSLWIFTSIVEPTKSPSDRDLPLARSVREFAKPYYRSDDDVPVEMIMPLMMSTRRRWCGIVSCGPFLASFLSIFDPFCRSPYHSFIV
jgi:hypothetical protein